MREGVKGREGVRERERVNVRDGVGARKDTYEQTYEGGREGEGRRYR